jgi:outer membrane protein assembly factor BamB
MKRRNLLIAAIGLAAIIVVSSLIIYENENPGASTGSWQRPIQNFATSIAADNDNVYVMDIFGNVQAFSTQTGSSIWNTTTTVGYFASGMVLSSDKVYVGGEVASVGCLDKASGEFEWSFYGQINTDLWTKRAPDSIVVSGDIVASVDGGVSVHDANNGAFLWQASRPYYPVVNFGNLTDLNNWWVGAYPLGGNPFDGDFVYVLSGDYQNPYVSKFNFKTASFAWNSSITLTQFPIAYPEAYPGYSSNAVSILEIDQGKIVIQNINQILCLSESTGEKLWSINVGASVYQPTNYNGALFFGASDGNFYAANLSNGVVLWKTKVDNNSLMPTVNNDNVTLSVYPIQVENRQIYWSFGVTQQLGTNSENKHDRYLGTVCNLDLATGKLLWTRQIDDSGVFFGFSPGLVVNENSIFLNENYALWIFSATNGNVAKDQTFDHYVLAPVTASDEVIVAADLQLTAYK